MLALDRYVFYTGATFYHIGATFNTLEQLWLTGKDLALKQFKSPSKELLLCFKLPPCSDLAGGSQLGTIHQMEKTRKHWG